MPGEDAGVGHVLCDYRRPNGSGGGLQSRSIWVRLPSPALCLDVDFEFLWPSLKVTWRATLPEHD